MNNEEQLLFDFADDNAAEDNSAGDAASQADTTVVPEEKKKRTVCEKDTVLKMQDMQRAVLAWLLRRKPSGMATSVPTRISKYRADIAAFWSSPAKKRLLAPDKTMIVEIRRNREQCWPDCTRQEKLLPLMRAAKAEKASLEALLREEEPELREGDTLFPEFETWNYTQTKNRKYHKCLRHIEQIEHALYKGSRFEQIRRAHVADYLYLAVPAGTVLPDELADGWGLINIHPDMSAEVVQEAEKWDCPEQNKLHLIQHIAACCRQSLLFSMGIRELPDGAAAICPKPRRRRIKKIIR